MSALAWRSRRTLIGCTLAGALALGCGGGGDGGTGPGPDPDPAPVAAVTVTPDNSLVVVDDAGQLTAQTTDSNGTVLTGRTVTWSSLDETLATVSTSGQVSARSFGDARIVATSEGKSDTVIVRARLRFTQVSAGLAFTCGLLESGAAWCWGDNQDGMLGARLSADSTTVPQPVRVADGHHFTSISVGSFYACALDQDRAAWCWGEGTDGQLGNGIPDQPVNAPVKVIGDHRFLAISAGSGTTCALDESHLAYCWGDEFRNSIPGRTGDVAFPVAIAAPPDIPQALTFDSIKVRLGDACGIATPIDGGELWCWGDNTNGQVADATVDPVFTRIGAPVTPFTYGIGDNFICYTGVDSDTRQSHISQCRGVDIVTGQTVPNTILDLPAIDQAIALDAGARGGCAILVGGELRCWGGNASGQLGIGSTGGSVSEPVIPAGGHTWSVISVGTFHTCGITTDGITYCWGSNGSGLLGEGTLSDRNVPTAVVGQL